jgi:hypothetical protein
MSIDIRVKPDHAWGESRVEDMLEVCLSVADCFSPAIAERSTEPITLVYDTKTPRTRFDRVDGRIQVQVTATDHQWAALTFEFGHELTHVLSNYREPEQHPIAWLEEALCQMGALFALRRMARVWSDSPPYENWRDYAGKLDAYAQSHLPAASVSDYSAWLATHRPLLEQDCYRRDDTLRVASRLLQWFEKQPDAWRAVRYLNRWSNLTAADPLEAFFEKWHRAVPQRLRAHVRAARYLVCG